MDRRVRRRRAARIAMVVSSRVRFGRADGDGCVGVLHPAAGAGMGVSVGVGKGVLVGIGV